jgi:hypothetical protein
MFSKGYEQEIIAGCKPTVEERIVEKMDFVHLYEEMETLTERKLSKEISGLQFSKIVVEMESAME